MKRNCKYCKKEYEGDLKFCSEKCEKAKKKKSDAIRNFRRIPDTFVSYYVEDGVRLVSLKLQGKRMENMKPWTIDEGLPEIISCTVNGY